MQCQNAQENFSDHIAGLLDRAHLVSLENHLADCSRCKEELADLRGVWSALERFPEAEPPAFFHENIMSRIAQEVESAAQPTGWDWRSLFRPRSLAFAAFAAMLLVAAFSAVLPSQSANMFPFSVISRLFHPDPAAPLGLQTQQANWTPNAQGSGELLLTLRAVPLPGNGIPNQLNVSITQAGHEVKHGIIDSRGDTHLKITLPSPDALAVTLTDAGSNAPQTGSTLPLVVTPAAP